jgi:undecaprenyl-diphosphatase
VETEILLWIHRLASPLPDVLFDFSNLFGLFPVCAALVAAMVVWHLARGERREAVVWLALGAATAVLPELIKHVAERARPALWPAIVHASGYSFPSGHAVAGGALYPLLGWDLLGSRPAASRLAYAAGAAFGVFVGLGRLYLGVHWPSDVLAGWVLGFAESAAACRFMRRPGALRGAP